jgi:hypothetical protein
VAQELGGAVVGSAIAAHAGCGSWARVGELVALVRREHIALEGPRVQAALARATKAKQWVIVLELLRVPCVAAAGGRAAGAATASAGATAAQGDGVAAAAIDGGAPFRWSRLSMTTALKACHQLGEWRQAVALLCELQPHAERDGAAAAGKAAGAGGGAAAAEAMAELRRQADAVDGGGGGDGGGGDGDGTSGGGVARVLCGEVGLDPGCFAYAMNACLTSREAGALEVAAGPLLAAAEAAGCADGAVYGTAMTACVRRGERARAWGLARRARAAGVQLNALACNIALGAAARCGELDGALSLLGEMRSAVDTACWPDVGSYDALLPRLAGAGRHAEVLEAFDELQAATANPGPGPGPGPSPSQGQTLTFTLPHTLTPTLTLTRPPSCRRSRTITASPFRRARRSATARAPPRCCTACNSAAWPTHAPRPTPCSRATAAGWAAWP